MFTGETWATPNIAARNGRCEKGKRRRVDLPFGPWKTTPFVAALRNDRITAPYRFRAGDYRIAFQIELNFAFTPYASDAEFLEKLRYLYAQQAKIWDLPDNGDDYGCIVIAVACHFCPVNA